MIQALRLSGYGNLGGYLRRLRPLLPTLNVTKNIVSMYRTPLIEVATKCVYTNTTLVSAYRGAGRPEGAFNMERTDRLRGGRAGHRPLRIAPAQFHPRQGNAVQGRLRHDL